MATVLKMMFPETRPNPTAHPASCDLVPWQQGLAVSSLNCSFLSSPAGDTKVKNPDDLSADTMAK